MTEQKISYKNVNIEQSRREYNQWVATESLEDYSLRYAPNSYRKWPESLIANTALGSISFLALEAIGATIALQYGFSTAFWAILFASLIIFIAAIPICYHAANENIDIDLITRSAGFGYIGSTITSLIYASFSFLFFALEAAILAQAFELYFELPLPWGYLLSSLIIIPIVFYGITFINKLQLWTQPIWLVMMFAPFVAILTKDPAAFDSVLQFSGSISQTSEFNYQYFGFAMGISLSLIPQIGEQVDYLRFMPTRTKQNSVKWWVAMLVAGPGWVILGFAKQIGGIFLASLVMLAGLSVYEAKSPVHMYHVGYQYVFDNPSLALAACVLFVVISQIKINVTNAYAGSLAWSNFFSRITHSHPGRVVWLVFNITIALLLMELGVFDVLEKVLGLYSNVAIAWIGVIFTDLMINKPLGLSPKIIEFKRAHLYNFNPVGIGAMAISSSVSILAFTGYFGVYPQSYSSLIALVLALIFTPLFAYLTKGKYYIARKSNGEIFNDNPNGNTLSCGVCQTHYDVKDMASCPFHEVNICSLCCSLDSLCHDVCKKESEQGFRNSIANFICQVLKEKISQKDALRLFDFISISSLLSFILAFITYSIYIVQIVELDDKSALVMKGALFQTFVIVGILLSVITWWILLLQEGRSLAEQDLEEQNNTLALEILSRQKTEDKNHQLANYDTLTGLPNRYYLYTYFDQEISFAVRENKQFALIFLDLDRFKLVNDTLGHDAGDDLLKLVAQRMKLCVRDSDTVCRLSGDEFIILLRGIDHTDQITQVAKKLIKMMSDSFDVQGHQLTLTFSIGISVYPTDGENISSLLKHADIAMYKVKECGKNNFKFFNTAMNDNIKSSLFIEQGLRVAIKENQLKLYYQPQWQNNKVVGYEALVRWQHPEKGLLYPEKFIDIAEQSELIIMIGEWVLKTACRQGNEWLVQGYDPLPIAVNVSQKQFNHVGFVGFIQNLLQQENFASELLELEITESLLMENTEEVIAQLNIFKSMGIKLSIDDFGTGFSSLSYLKILPIDQLKIDRSFVQNVVDNEEDKSIIKAIISLAHNLNLKTIAEGVETQEQLDLLNEFGVDIMQGFFFSPGLSPEKAIKLQH